MKADHTPGAGGTRIAGATELRRRFLSHRQFASSTARRSRPRNEWGFARYARRNPGFAAWCVVLILAGTQVWTWDTQQDKRDRARAAREAQKVARAHSFVDESLDAIGHGVSVNGVEVKPLNCGAYGLYHLATRTISIDLNLWQDEEDVLATAAHESVHALFHRINWKRDRRSVRPFHQLVEETTAEVLGAYIAGRVWERRGHDGEALTRRLISDLRDYCDPTKPHSLYQNIAALQARKGQYIISPGAEWYAHIHFGSTALIDDIDAICRAHPDPWDAANAIIHKYMRDDSIGGGKKGSR